MFVFRAFQEGGPFMYVIFAFALFTLAFVTERWSYLYKNYKGTPTNFRKLVMENVLRGDFRAAQVASVQTQTSIGQVVAAGCEVRGNGGSEEEVQARMDEALSKQLEIIDRRTGFLAMFGNVATLVGLLGTISGMIHSFAAVATASPMDRATLLSKGISEAMNCTAFGLIVAVPALVTYAIFQNKTDRIVNELTNNTSEIYHDLIFMYEGAPATHAIAKAHKQPDDKFFRPNA